MAPELAVRLVRTNYRKGHHALSAPLPAPRPNLAACARHARLPPRGSPDRGAARGSLPRRHGDRVDARPGRRRNPAGDRHELVNRHHSDPAAGPARRGGHRRDDRPHLRAVRARLHRRDGRDGALCRDRCRRIGRNAADPLRVRSDAGRAHRFATARGLSPSPASPWRPSGGQPSWLPTTDQNADRVAGRKVVRRSMVVRAMPSPWVAVEAGTELLARARQIQRSWDRLLGEGALGPELPPQATAGMRPMIVESWKRVAATGLEPIDVLPSIEADASETRERWLEHPLGLLRHVLVEPLQMLAEESNSVVQVTDPSGLTLYLGGPEWLKARAAEMNLVEGARCSETVNGTNGVGTALATDHPVQVFAFEHFSHHHREWVCSGAPIRDSVSGRLVGIIDLSSPWRIAHPRSLELVTR